MNSSKYKPITSILKYEKDSDRWGMMCNNDDWHTDYLHCEDMFFIKIGEQKLKCRIEMDSDWYVISSNKRFKLHPKEQYEVIIP